MTATENEDAGTGAAAPKSSATSALDGPGRQIRSARERAGLSLDELAAQTKLARGTLDAIERDDFSVLSEPVYVRGYYRKCAKVLGLDDAGLIASYEGLVAPKAPAPPTKPLLAGGDELVPPRRSGLRWLLLLLLLLALAVIVLGLLNRAPSVISSHSTSSQVAVQPTVPVAPAEAVSAPSMAASAVVPATPQTQSPNASSRSPAMSASAPGPAIASPSSGAIAQQPAGSARALLPHAGSELALQFRQTSWVRVEDGDGRVLLSGVIQGGERQTLIGKPPFSVFLGNAPGVTVDYQGRRVDISRYTRSNATARFTVP